MKKYKFFVLILLITLITSIGVNADTIDGDYSYTTYDNEGYDLITGEALENINMSRTNRVEIARDSIDDKIYFNDSDFSHVLFFNSSNIYIGYGNGNGSTRELSSYIGAVVPDGGAYSIEVPENARKFALMNYNYQDTRNLIAYTQPSIDAMAWETLSYRDIFAGTNLIINGDFNDTHIEYEPLFNLFDETADLTVDGFTVNVVDADNFTIKSTGYTGIIDNEWLDISFSIDTQYTISGNYHSETGASNDWLIFYYTDLSYDYFILTSPTETAFTFTSDVLKSVDHISLFDWGSSSPDEFTYFNNFKIEEGAIATEYSIPYDAPDNWLYGMVNPHGEVIGGRLKLRNDDVVTDLYTILYNDYIYSNGHTVYFYYELESNSTYTDFDIAVRYLSSPYTTLYVDEDANRNEIYYSSFLHTFTDDIGVRFDIQLEYTNYIYADNIKAYDLTALGFITMPTTAEFETMKLYYDTYKDVSGDEISYNDIYDNNLITNSFFDIETTGWVTYSSSFSIQTFQLTGPSLRILGGGVSNWMGAYTITTNYPNENDVIYYNVDIDPQDGGYNYFDFLLRNGSSGNYDNRLYVDTADANIQHYSDLIILSETFGYPMRVYTRLYYPEPATSYLYTDNIIVYNLTDIFEYVGDDIDEGWIELNYLTWIDPLSSDYPNYYLASTLILNTVYYKYDDTPPAPADFQTSFDDKLVSIGVDTPQEELFGAFLIMIIVAVLLGLKFKSVAIVMIAELSLIFIFTVLGWFSLWFILVLALTFVLLILLKALKGGQK